LSKYDDVVKRLGRLRPKDLVLWLCPSLKVQDVIFVDREFELTNRRVDILYKVQTADTGDFYFHLEFQSALKQDFSIRMHEYSTRIRRELKLPVKTIAVFLDSTQAIQELVPVDRCEFAGEFISEFRYTKIILANEEWRSVLTKELPALWTLLSLTKIAKGEEQEALGRASEAIEKIPEKELRSELAAIFYLIGGYRYPKVVRQVIGEKLMQDLMESETYREAVEMGEKKILLKVLKGKFGDIPQALQDKLSNITVEDLDILAEKIGTIRSLKEFKKILTDMLPKQEK
jgi:hypothetical protein